MSQPGQPRPQPQPQPTRSGLGDHVTKALSAIGITSERVEKWLGRPCKCKERAARLNQLGAWAMRVLTGKAQPDEAKKHLDEITAEGEEPKKP